MIGNIHTIGVLSITGSGAFILAGINTMNVNPAVKELMEAAGGQVDPSFIGTMNCEPMITATITDVAVALSNGIGLSGCAIPQTSVLTGLDAYFTKMVNGGTRGAGSTNFKSSLTQALIVPKSITAAQNGKATMEIEIHTVFDGTNNPLTYTDSVALPAVPAIAEMFTLGKCSINGTVVNGVQSLTLDFGISVLTEYASGDVFPTFVAIGERKPKITLKVKEVPSLTTFGLTGTAQGSTASVFYFQKLAVGGTRVANATAQHIKISTAANAGEIWCNAFGGQNNAVSEGEIVIQPIATASTAVLTISSASAIT